MQQRFITLPALIALSLALLLVASCGSDPEARDDDAAGSADDTEVSGERRIAFISDRAGAYHLYTMNPDGSDVRQLSDTDLADTAFSVSNDGSQVIAVEALDSDEGGSPIALVRIDADGGGEQRLTALPPASMDVVYTTRRWQSGDIEALMQHEEICYAVPTGGGDADERSPDDCLVAQIRAEGTDGRWAAIAGESLVVGEGSGWDDYDTIDQVLPDMTEEEGFAGFAFLALQLFGFMQPLWSPDGSRLAYVDADANGAQGIALIDADGSNGRLVMEARGDVSMALPGAWSDDGSQLYFAGMDDDSSIHVIDVDGDGTQTLLGGDGYAYKHPRLVTAADPPEREAGEARATPDAEAAAADLADVQGRLLYEQGYYGGFLTAQPDGSGQQQLTEDSPYPSFLSNDGRWLSFTAGRGLSGTITIVDTLTGERREYGIGSSPTVSPGGDRIAYWDGALTVLSITTGDTEYFSAGAGIDPEEASWSPDGTRLAYFSEIRGYEDDGPVYELIVADLASGEVTVVAETRSGLLDGGPIAWSPDSAHIAFDDSILRIARSDGGGVEDYAIDASSSAWSPNGSTLVVRGFGIVLLDPDSGDITELTNDVAGAVEYPPAWSPDGAWIAYSGSDEQLRVMNVASRTVIRPGQEADILRWLPQ